MTTATYQDPPPTVKVCKSDDWISYEKKCRRFRLSPLFVSILIQSCTNTRPTGPTR